MPGQITTPGVTDEVDAEALGQPHLPTPTVTFGALAVNQAVGFEAGHHSTAHLISNL
ncbi:hypothetical protein ACFYV7_12055 [Nocardia suismassiliense]|uniref:Uncharacterized protein n=1 Tax=Nocardia suismassiliense TaxID=2077092 RepID=A0ABW6QQL0_9NOCA